MATLYKYLYLFFFFASITLWHGSVCGEVGITDSEIILGQSCALTGPAGNLGSEMAAGLRACFAKVNQNGGIKGRRITLITRDDRYEPRDAILNTLDLSDKVFLLIGEVGTPTSKATVPIVERVGVPFFGPFTGAGFLRHPFKKYVINLRASYAQEMEHLARFLVDQQGLDRIACLYQNDSYGQAGLAGIEQALDKRSLSLVSKGHYERNTVAVKSALLQIRRGKPDAVVLVGAYKPCAAFIRLARTIGMTDTIFSSISFVGTASLVEELGPAGNGCIISQVVPFPYDDTAPAVKEYLEAMGQFAPDVRIGFVSLEGFLVGKLFCEVISRIKGDPDRESFIQTLDETERFDLGGFIVDFSPEDHQGSDKVFLTEIQDGKVRPLKE